MQNRMKMNQLNKEEIENLLKRTETGSLATINEDGGPYVIPVHFVYYEDSIFVHSLPKGKKLDNIKSNPNICLSIYEMQGLLLDSKENPCDTNTKYESVVIFGKATLLEDVSMKETILKEIIKKYTPNLISREIPENMLKGTAVTKIEIKEITGKYYK